MGTAICEWQEEKYGLNNSSQQSFGPSLIAPWREEKLYRPTQGKITVAHYNLTFHTKSV